MHFKVKEKWIEICRMLLGDNNWTPYSRSRICSRHFKPEDFSSINRLQFTAIPSLHLTVLDEIEEIVDASMDIETQPLIISVKGLITSN